MADSANQPTPPPVAPNPGDRCDTSNLAYRAAVGTALVAAVFLLVVCALLLYDYTRRQGDNPQEAAALMTLKGALKHEETGPELKKELEKRIRELDLQLNNEFRRQQRFARFGKWFLLCGGIVFLASAIAAAVLRRTVPIPAGYAPPPDLDARTARIGSWAVGVLAWLIVLGALVWVYCHESPLSQSKEALLTYSEMPKDVPAGPKSPSGVKPPSGVQPPAPAASTEPYDPPAGEEIAKWWPRFRGPGGSGHSRYTNVPTTWNAATGENIRWKTPVPLPGNNSPVVWGDRVFLSGATEQKRQVYCFDAKDGKLLWQRDIAANNKAKPPKVSQDTGFAAPTMVTDGHNVFAMFASGDIAALDFKGGIAWERNLGTPDNSYGHAASLAMYQSFVFVQFDQATKKDKKSKMLALRAVNGKTAWQTDREVPNSWASPIVAEGAGRPQLITSADPWVIAYDPADGAEIWRCNALRQDVGPSPISLGGIAYVVNVSPAGSAIQMDGTGDVTDTKVAWSVEDGLPDTSSPLVTDEFFFLANADTLTCYDVKTGEMLWEEYKQFEDANFISSPGLVGKRVYLVSKDENKEDGLVQKSYVVEPDREKCKPIGQGTLGESCITSPAFQDGCLYLRGEKHLFCIGKPLATP